MEHLKIDCGAKIEATSDDVGTALAYAAGGNASESIQLLVQAGAKINHQNAAQQTPLYWAIRKDAIDAFKVLVESGAGVTKTSDCPTLLKCAQQHNARKIVKYLEEKPNRERRQNSFVRGANRFLFRVSSIKTKNK